MPHKPGHFKPFTDFLTQGMQNTNQNISNMNQPQFKPFSDSLANANINTFKVPNQFSQNQGGGNNILGTEAGWSEGVEGETEGVWTPGTAQDPIELNVGDPGDPTEEDPPPTYTAYHQWWEPGNYVSGILPVIQAATASNPILQTLNSAPGSSYSHQPSGMNLSNLSGSNLANMNINEARIKNNYADNPFLTGDYAPGMNPNHASFDDVNPEVQVPYGAIVDESPFGDNNGITSVNELNHWQENEWNQIINTGNGSSYSDMFNMLTKSMAFGGNNAGGGGSAGDLQDVINTEADNTLSIAESSMGGMTNEQKLNFYNDVFTGGAEAYQPSVQNIESSFGIDLPDWSHEFPFFNSLNEMPPMMMYNISQMIEDGEGIENILNMANDYVMDPPPPEENQLIEDYIAGHDIEDRIAKSKRFAKKLYYPAQDDSGFTAVGEGLNEELLEQLKNMQNM